MNKNFRALSLILLLSVISQASAKDLVLRWASAQDIMTGTDVAQAASKAVEDERKGYMNLAKTRVEDLERKKKDLNAKIASGTMSTETQRKEATTIANLEQALESDQKQWMQELQTNAQNQMEKIGREFDLAVQKVAKEQDADFVFERESGRIVYAKESLNLTNDVKVAMNAEHKTTQVASAKKDAAAPAIAKKATA